MLVSPVLIPKRALKSLNKRVFLLLACSLETVDEIWLKKGRASFDLLCGPYPTIKEHFTDLPTPDSFMILAWSPTSDHCNGMWHDFFTYVARPFEGLPAVGVAGT